MNGTTSATETPLHQHPLSAAFPSMPVAELAALAIDIEAHGQREPGVTLDGMILDGWHRFLACRQVGVEFKANKFDGADPVAFVISRNLHRRHLTASQRAACVVAASGWRGRGNVGKSVAATDLSAKEMAKAADVGVSTIEKAKAAERAHLGEHVRDGDLTVEQAAKVAKLPKAKREKAVQAIRDGVPPSLPKPKVVVAERKFEKLYEAVKAELADYKDRYETLGETARELQDKLEMFEAVEPDEQQKMIATLQKTVQRKDGEITRLRGQASDLNNKCNALIRQVKSLQKAK